MVALPELGRPAEHRDEVPCDYAGRRPIRSCSLHWVGEGDPDLFYWQITDHPTGDIRHVPLKEGREEDVP